MDKTRFAAQWGEIRPKVQHHWSRVTPQDLDQVRGDPDVLISILMEKYEEPRQAIELQVRRLADRQIGAP